MEKFNSEYRRFAKVAKDLDFDKTERKIIAKNPKRMIPLENEVGRRITSHALSSFFSALGEKDSNPEETVKLGNYFYRYRPDVTNPVEHFSEGDERVFNLGCKLIEDAFYSGRLAKLSRDSSAALAFTINIAAKVAENPKFADEILAFDIEEARKFVESVKSFHEEILSQAVKATDALSTAEQSEKISKLEMLANRFRGSANAVMANLETKGKSAIPYLIKSCLIVSDMTGEYRNSKREITRKGNYLNSGRFFPGDALYIEQGTPSYSFYKQRDKPYARQHFIPEEIPFAVWAQRYLRTKHVEKS